MCARFATLLLSTVCVICVSFPASAATLVLGMNGAAYECYRSAKANDVRGVPVCNVALGEVLSTRDRAATLINRGALLILKGDLKGGLADSENSIGIYVGLGEAYVNRGVALRELGQPQDAIESLDKGISMALVRPELAYFDRALAKEDVGDVKGAYADFKKALEINPDFKLAEKELTRFRVVPNA